MLFLLCILFYQGGVQAVITLAAIYAEQAMHFTTHQTITLILVVNVTASIGAFAFGQLQDKLGHVRTLAITLGGWCVMVLMAWFADGPAMFWAAANLAGICLGASQSAGRALVGYMSPPDRLAGFFGLWGLAGEMVFYFLARTLLAGRLRSCRDSLRPGLRDFAERPGEGSEC